MGGSDSRESFFHERLRSSSNKFLWVGIALIVVGIAAIVFPIVSTLVATVFVGWVLLFAGFFILVGSFSVMGAGPFFGALLLSLLSIGAGVFLLAHPAAGATALMLVIGVVFMLQGASELVFALEMRPYRPWAGMLVSAILSIGLALLIVISWPGISMVALGILIGINFISSGIGYIAASRVLRP